MTGYLYVAMSADRAVANLGPSAMKERVIQWAQATGDQVWRIPAEPVLNVPNVAPVDASAKGERWRVPSTLEHYSILCESGTDQHVMLLLCSRCTRPVWVWDLRKGVIDWSMDTVIGDIWKHEHATHLTDRVKADNDD